MEEKDEVCAFLPYIHGVRAWFSKTSSSQQINCDAHVLSLRSKLTPHQLILIVECLVSRAPKLTWTHQAPILQCALFRTTWAPCSTGTQKDKDEDEATDEATDEEKVERVCSKKKRKTFWQNVSNKRWKKVQEIYKKCQTVQKWEVFFFLKILRVQNEKVEKRANKLQI